MGGFLKVVTPQLLRYLVPVPLSHRRKPTRVTQSTQQHAIQITAPSVTRQRFPVTVTGPQKQRHLSITTRTQNSIPTVKAKLHLLLASSVYRLPRPLQL